MAEKQTALVRPSTAISTKMTTPIDTRSQFGDISIFCVWSSNEGHIAGMVRHSEGLRKEEPREATPKPEMISSSTSVQPTADETALEGDSRFIIAVEEVPLTMWQARRISAVPTLQQEKFTLTELRTIIPSLITAARVKVVPKDIPIYYVLYIGKSDKSVTSLPWWTRRKRFIENGGATGGLAGRPMLKLETLRKLLDMIDEVRNEMGLALAPGKIYSTAAVDAAYYEHYSPSRRERGYLTLDPRFSIVIDCAEDDVLTLLTMLQQAQITYNGLTAPGFAAAQLRVSLWDSNSDIQASLDDLSQVSRDGAASALGQILLSFALAGIGTLLALMTLPGARQGQLVAPLLIYALASILHAFYALIGKKVFFWLGIFCLVLATMLAIIIFAFPAFVIPFLPNGHSGG